MKRVVLDVDDVILDTAQGVEIFLNEYHQTTSEVYLDRGQYWDNTNTNLAILKSVYDLGNFYQNYVGFMPHAVEGLKLLTEDDSIKVYIVTAEPNLLLFQDKGKQLANLFDKHKIDIDLNSSYIRCIDKSIIRSDYIVDDYIKNIRDCREVMKAILYNRPYNSNEIHDCRVNNLVEAYNIITQV